MRKLLLLMITACIGLVSYAETITLDIKSQDDFTQNWTVIDVNGDGGNYQWHYGDQDAIYNENRSKAADDWLISPGVQLEGGTTYKVSSSLRNASTYGSDKQKFKICAGKQPEVDELSTNVIYKNESLSTGMFYSNYDGNFTPDESGTYYFAIHCYSASYNGDFRFQKFVIEKQVAHPGAVTDLTITPAEKGELQATVTWTWPTKNDLDGPYSGQMDAYIYRHTSSTFPSDLNSCLVGTVENGNPGESGSFTDNTLTAPGKYYYQVIPFNSDGTSTSKVTSVESPWIGKDTQLGYINNVVATVIDDHTVSLTFDIPGGYNGGYVDPAEISYRITRTAGTSSAITIVDNYKGELPYIDNNVNGLNSYTYTIYSTYNGTEDTWRSGKSNAVTLGGAVEVPYSQDFSTTNHFFEFFHGEDATRDWSVSSSRLQYWGNPADAYAVSPGINLKAGVAYQLTFSTRISSATSGSEKPLKVKIGKERTIAGLNKELYSETITSTIAATKTIDITVSEDGVYYLAFHCQGTVNSNDIYVDDINLKEIPVAPLAAVDFNAVAAEKGEKKVTLTWTNPTENNAGGSIVAITKAVIKRGNDELTSITEGNDLIAGAKVTYIDESIENAGKYEYSVILYLNNNASPEEKAAVDWVGLDIPNALTGAVALKDDDTGVVTITWEPLQPEGKNGGYVETENITYKVVRLPDNKEISSGKADTSATDPGDDASLGKYSYSITVEQYPDMEAAVTEKVTLGDAIEVTEGNPYTPDFSSANDFELWTLTKGGEDGKLWEYNKSDKTLETGFMSNNPWAITPPLKLLKGKYKVKYKATCYSARYTSNIEIYLTDAPTHDADLKNKIHEAKIESVSWPNTTEVEFDVENDGIYYIGYVDVTADHWKLALSQADVELVELAARPVAPMAAENFTATAAEKGDLKVTLSWKNPTKDNEEKEIVALTMAVISKDGEEIHTITTGDDLEAGAEVTYTDENITDAGIYNYSVTLYIQEFASEAAEANSGWVGEDSPKSLKNASAVKDETTGTVTISWDALDEKGEHDGYIDTDNVTYKVVRMPDNKEIATGINTTTVNDPADDADFGLYYYEISVEKFADLEPTATDKLLIGDAYVVAENHPYQPDFSTAEFLELWTLTNGGEEDGKLWEYNDGTLVTNLVNNNPWAITPPLKLEEGVYKVDYKAICYNSLHTSNIEIYLTDAPSHEASLKTLIHKNEITSAAFPGTISAEFKVEKAGIYYIGYVDATEDSWKLALSQADVEWVSILPTNPLPASEFTATAAQQGEMSATLSWTNPSKDKNGTPFKTLTKVVVTRNDVELSNIPVEVLAVGQEVSFVDESITDPGIYNYTITLYLDEMASEVAEATTGWIGLDTPKPIKNAKAVKDEATGTVAISWDALADKGEHDGYVDTDNVTYKVVRMPDNEVIVESSTETTASDPAEDVEYGEYYYLITVVNYPELEGAKTVNVVLGTPAPQPAAPKAPANVTVELQNDGSRVVKFDAVNKDINDVEIDNVTYNVYRNETLLTQTPITSLTYVDDATGLEYSKFIYAVEALYDSFISELTEGEPIYFGEALDMEHNHDFATENELWKVSGADENSGWNYNDEETDVYFISQDNSSMLMTPPMDLKAGIIKVELEAQSDVNTRADETKLHIYVVKEEHSALQGNDMSEKIYKLEEVSVPSVKDKLTVYSEIPTEYEGVGRLVFIAGLPQDGASVKLYSLSVSKESEKPSGLSSLSQASGSIIYDRKAETMYLPGEGTLEIFSLAGMKVMSVSGDSSVSISGLAPATYLARFCDLNGKVYTLKFIK